MERHVKTRSQRRMEKKQALTVLALTLVVSLASFTLGVMVGRRSGDPPPQVATEQVETPPVQVAQSEPPEQSTPADEAAPAAEVVPANELDVSEPAATVETEQEEFSFYNRLPEEETPLGSGMNPAEKQEAAPVTPPPSATTVSSSVTEEAKPPQIEVKKTVEQEAAAQPAADAVVQEKAATTADGDYAVQVGSFKSEPDAKKFKEKLLSQGYPAFVRSADLGEKGMWYRVRLGPYSKEGATKAIAQLKDQQNLAGFLTRR